MRIGLLAGILAVVAATAVGCSSTSTTSSPSTTATSAAATTTTSAAAQAGPVLDVTIANGQVTPANAALQAHVGQTITVHVTSDTADELHVHSTPDREFVVSATPNQTFTFTIDNPGKIDIELHHLDKTVATVDVTP